MEEHEPFPEIAGSDPAADRLGPPGDDPAEPSLRRRVFNLAWPVISENFLQTLLGVVDTLMVAQLGAEAIAGVGAAIQIMFFIISALSAISVGSSVLVAQAVGAQAFARAGRLAKQSLVWSVIISIPLIVAGLFSAEWLIAIFGMEPAVSAIGTEYLQVTMGTVVVLTLLLLGGGVLRGAGDSRTPMLITACANLVNVVPTYGLIFGRLGMPELGAVGSAWGTFLSRALGVAILLAVLWRGSHGITIRGRQGWWPNLQLARNILRIGIPAALEQMLISVGFLVLTIVVARLGTLALAAHRIAFNALSVAFLPGIGFGIAATALVGQSIGARRQEEGWIIARIATEWALIWMGSLGAFFFLFGRAIMGIFTDDPAVIEMGAAAFRPLALTMPFWAVLFVQGGALRGTGNTQYPLRVNTTGVWASVVLGALLLRLMGGGLATVWMAFLLVAPITSTLLLRRFRRAITREKLVAAFS